MATILLTTTTSAAAVRDVPNGSTVRYLVATILGLAYADVTINGVPAALETVLSHGDDVKLSNELTGYAAPAAPVAPAGYGAAQRLPTIGILFINNDGAGFADRMQVPAGQTIGTFVAARGYNAAGNEIRVNGQPVPADYVLRENDRVSLTPVKVAGAADGMIRVLYLNNQGEGFADYVNVIHGVTLGQFFSQRTNGGDPANFEIRVNGQPADRAYVLRENDRVSVNPTKVAGA